MKATDVGLSLSSPKTSERFTRREEAAAAPF